MSVRSRPRTTIALIYGPLIALAAVACADSPTSSDRLGPASVGSQASVLAVEPSSLTLTVGETASLKVTVRDHTGRVLPTSAVTWSVTDATVVRVDQSGDVTGLSAGSSKIVASAVGKTASVDVEVGGGPQNLVITGGDEQTAPPGQTLPVPLAVRVESAPGKGVGGVRVVWGVVTGGGSVSPSSSVTNAGGIATTSWTLGPEAGSQEARAEVPGVGTVGFTARAGQTSIASVSVTPSSASLDVGAQTQLVATARDAQGTAVDDVSWTWSTSDGGIASVSSQGVVTGVAAGTAAITAAADGKSASASVTVSAPATGPAALAIVSGSGQSMDVAETLANPLVVELRDSIGGPVAGATVTWSASGGGSTSAGSTVTGAQGRSQVTWTLGTSAGDQALTASVDGSGSVTFAATARPGPAVEILVSPPDPSAIVGESITFSANGKDRYGNRIETGWVWATTNSGVATISGSGVALTKAAGYSTIRAQGRETVGTATLEVIGTPERTLSKVSGDNQSGTVASTLTQPLVVQALDAQGAAVGGLEVSWSVTGGGGSLNATTTTTNAQGRASVVWTVGSQAGAQSVAAALEGANSVTFAATAAAGAGAVATVTVSPPSASVDIGSQQAFSAVAKDAAGNVVSAGVAWSSGDASIASVDAAGLATGLAAGTAEIRATVGGVTGKGTLTVRGTSAPSVASVTASRQSHTFTALAQTLQLSATAKDASGTNLSGVSFSWSSSDPSVATVDAMGRVTSKAVGAAAIIVSAACCADTVAVTVTQVPSSIVVSPSSVSLQAGQSQQLSAVVADANGQTVQNAIIDWSSDDAGVATVSPQGLVTAVAAGAAQVTASARATNLSASASVSVGSPGGGGGSGVGAGPNEPAGYKRVFVLGGGTVDPDVENPGFTSGAEVFVSSKWDVGGSPPAAGGNRVESVNATGALDGKAIRHWLFAGDDSGWHGLLAARDLSAWVPPGWTRSHGTPRSYYWRVRLRLSANFQEHPHRYKPLGYIGSAVGPASSNDYYVSLLIGGPGDGNKVQFVPQGAGSDNKALFRTTSAQPVDAKGKWWDIEMLVTTESSAGANDGSVKMWINGQLFMSHSGLDWNTGMNGFEFPMFWGGSAVSVSVPSMFTDYDVYYISAPGG